MKLAWVAHNSAEYLLAVELRRCVLRAPLGLDFSEEDLAAEADQLHLVAFGEGKTLGCLILVPIELGFKMRQVAVDPEFQRRGIGEQLVRESERIAKEMGAAKMELNARLTAVDFYKRLGYTVVGEEFIEVGIPHLKMLKAF
jgi:ribosomal protein S18 acetylase RimI-like enzyme